ncbi:hypothetical protein HY605_04445, partial [Candidatus Peregrinibacteria bacterium]|nr:hypothetical protein [Candidatus Peregrinibacteria bacterium]
HQGARETVSQEVERILGDNNLMKKGLARSLEYANKLRDEFLINDVSFNQKIGAFVEGYDIQNPESEANIKGWKAINQVIESEILSGYFEKIDAPAFLKSFVMARLQYKANEIIIDKIAQKVSTNQIVIRQKAVLTFQQSALESYEVAPERARQIIQNVFSKPEINQRSVARENVEEMTSEVMILRYQRMAAIKRDLASFNLTAQDYALDPADSTAMTEFRRHHPELSEGAKFLYIKNRLFELRQAQLEAQDDQMIATLVARSVVAESEGQSEAQIAAIQDEVNYQAYKDVYDQIDYNEAGYELLTQSAGTDLSGAAAYLIVANVDSPVLAQTFFDTIDATSARVTDLHLENGVLHGTVITRWSNERSFSMSPENGAISIEDKMADSGQRKANLQDGEDLKKALFLTDFEEGMRKEIKDFGELSGSESAVFARINDTELYEIVGELNLSLLENESKQRQFFQNFLSLLLEKGDEVPINDKLIILRKSLTDGKARSTFVRKLNHPSWEFKSALQNKKFAEFMDELRQGNVAD